MTETGYKITNVNSPISGWFSNYLYGALTGNDVEIAFVMFWANSNDGYYVPNPAVSNASDFIEFTAKPKSVLVNTLPNMYHNA